MQNKSNNVLVFMLLVLVFVLGGYIIYDKINDKNTSNDSTQTATTTTKTNKNDNTSIDNNSTNKTFVIDNKLIESAIKTSLIKNIGKDEKQGIWGYDNSIWAEGHKTLRTELKDDKIYAYVLAQIGTYTKKNGTYENTSGMAGPIVIIFTKNYEFISYEMPSDGEGWTESLKRIFPSDLVDQSTSVDYRVDFYQNQINAYLN
jgi:hypothetical protein